MLTQALTGLFLLAAACILLAGCTTSPDNRAADTTATPTAEPTATALPPTATSTSTPTATATATATPTATPTPTITPTSTPTATPTPTPQPAIEITNLELQDVDGVPLAALSVDEHPYFGGITPVHGIIRIEGEGNLVEVILEVLENDVLVAGAPLAERARAALVGPLGPEGVREVAAGQLLFELPSSDFAEVDKTTNSRLTLRIRAVLADGREYTRDFKPDGIWKLIRYRGDNRYLTGDLFAERGGNEWVQPGVNTIIAGWQGVEIGDFSDMNGGPFPPHVSHQRGLDADVYFPGYENLDAVAAETLLALIDGQPYVSRIDLIFVAYSPVDGDPFWDVIKGVTLSDGRPAAQVFYPEAEHTGHFHVRFVQWEGP